MADSPSHQQFIRRFEEARLSALADLAAGRYGYASRLLQQAEALIGGRLRGGYGKEDALQSLFRVLGRDFHAGIKRNFAHSGALRRFLEFVLRNRIRLRGARRSASPLPSGYEQDDSSSDRETEALEAKELVDAALCRLPPRQQEICRLFAQDRNVLRISRQLRCSRRTVHRALEHFAFVVRGILNARGTAGSMRAD